MMKYLVALLVIGALGAGIYIYSAGSPTPEGGMEENTSTVSGMLAEENAVVAMEQRPGSAITVSVVYLASPGYVVIHESVNGAPGAILGASVLLAAGESRNVVVNLSRATVDGETLVAMLHTDTDASGTFDAALDGAVESRLGGPIMGMFVVSTEASSTLPEVSI